MKTKCKFKPEQLQGWLQIQRRELEHLKARTPRSLGDAIEIVNEIGEIEIDILATEQRLSEFAA